jgi:GNAT superfamily N-acetyltransferase
MNRAVHDVRIERATLAQLAAAYVIIAEYYEAMRVVARETIEEFQKSYFGPASAVWLASAGSDLVGCITLREIAQGDAAEVKRMYVREGYRGLGIAQKLLAEAEHFARNKGYQRIFLDSTDGMQAAVRLYERNGYQRCERYNNNPQATIFMRKDLNQGAPNEVVENGRIPTER